MRDLQPDAPGGGRGEKLTESRDDRACQRGLPRAHPLESRADARDLRVPQGIRDHPDVRLVEHVPVRTDDPGQTFAGEFSGSGAPIRGRDRVETDIGVIADALWDAQI